MQWQYLSRGMERLVWVPRGSTGDLNIPKKNNYYNNIIIEYYTCASLLNLKSCTT